MAEPHQRVQSGKLRPTSKRNISDIDSSSVSKISQVTVGVEDAEDLEVEESDDILSYFAQTPTSLSSLHIQILTNIANECGISGNNIINKDWRNTWNIGVWCVGSQVSISVNIMQPNISGAWVSVVCNIFEDAQSIIDKYNSYTLEKSTCSITGRSNPYQIKGRWSLHATEELLSLRIIRGKPDISGINVCQSKIFIWVLVGNQSEYLCSLTQASIVLLARYIPDWCSDIQEPTEAKNITLRVKNPNIENDASHLSISTSGSVQFNGRADNVARLYGALTIALRNVIVSPLAKSFLESLHYDIVPENF